MIGRLLFIYIYFCRYDYREFEYNCMNNCMVQMSTTSINIDDYRNEKVDYMNDSDDYIIIKW